MLVVLAGLFVLPSCRPDDTAESIVSPESAGSTQTVAGESAGDDNESIALHTASWEDTQKIIAAHQGKIVILDLWSTYCPPCIAELPGLGQLQQRYKDDVVCLSLNCNFNGIGSPEDERDAILKVLDGTKPVSQHLVSSDPDEQLYAKVGIASIPVVQVYDRSGKLRKQFDNEKNEYGDQGFTYSQHIAPFVADLVTADRGK
jgi:thiol-disulfide isomerase/thioredoxin